MTSACGKYYQVRLLFLNLTHARPYRVPFRTNLHDTYRELLENLRGETPGLQHLPPRESLSNRGELGPIFPLAAARMHDD